MGFHVNACHRSFLWVTRASCVHRMIVGIMCVERCFVDAHLERRQFDCGRGFLFAHVTSFVLLSLSRAIHGERIFAPTQVGNFVTESRQRHVREHTARIR